MPALGSDLNITVYFRDQSEVLADPDSIEYSILDSNGNEVNSATPSTPEKLATGTYLFVWEPSEQGEFTFSVTGVFDGSDDITLEYSFVITADNNDTTAPVLSEDVTITFSSGFDPMLVDPELIQPYMPEAENLEIAQFVHRFSLEVLDIFPNGDHPPVALDYIFAATLCALSRVHEGMGVSNYSGFTLGDLQVQSGQSNSAGSSNRGSVDSWCELAEILRKELRTAKGGIKSAVKSSKWGSPVPNRDLSRAEFRKCR